MDIGAYGSISHGGVFSSSLFGQKILNKTIMLPQPDNLPGSNVPMGYFLVGDAAFPLCESLMRPYAGRNLNVVKAVFNYRARRIIENTFGKMVARWRIYHRAICASPTTIDRLRQIPRMQLLEIKCSKSIARK
jgi:hypothetical protein